MHCLVIKAHLSPGGGWRLHWRIVFGKIPRHLRHEPLEVLAVQPVPQVLLRCHVSSREVPILGSPLVDELRVLVHPHLRHALQILREITWYVILMLNVLLKQCCCAYDCFILILYIYSIQRLVVKFFFGHTCNMWTVIVPLAGHLVLFYCLFSPIKISQEPQCLWLSSDRAFPRDSEQIENLNLISHQCIIRWNALWEAALTLARLTPPGTL